VSTVECTFAIHSNQLDTEQTDRRHKVRRDRILFRVTQTKPADPKQLVSKEGPPAKKRKMEELDSAEQPLSSATLKVRTLKKLAPVDAKRAQFAQTLHDKHGQVGMLTILLENV
jgi:hypothetical protein